TQEGVAKTRAHNTFRWAAVLKPGKPWLAPSASWSSQVCTTPPSLSCLEHRDSHGTHGRQRARNIQQLPHLLLRLGRVSLGLFLADSTCCRRGETIKKLELEPQDTLGFWALRKPSSASLVSFKPPIICLWKASFCQFFTFSLSATARCSLSSRCSSLS
ncbi:hypothetical protein JZ751_020558, partial [Albula glossodonta]